MADEAAGQREQPGAGLTLVAQIVPVLAGLLGLATYVLVLGAAVLWLRLDQADLPTEVPVSLAARQEMIAVGAQALAVWVALVAVLAVLVAQGFSDRGLGRLRPIVSLVLGMAVAGSLLGGPDTSRWAWTLPLLAVAIVVVAAVLYRPSARSLTRTLIPATCGGVLVWLVWHLADHQRFVTIVSAGATLVVALLVLPELRDRHASRVANEDALARFEGSSELEPGHERVLSELRQQTQRRRLAHRLQWVAFSLVVLTLLGGVAVSSQLDNDDNFRAAYVSLEGGRCVSGTYLARNDAQLVLGEPAREHVDDPDPDVWTQHTRAVVIPTARVIEVQVSGPLERPAQLREVPCAERAVVSAAK